MITNIKIKVYTSDGGKEAGIGRGPCKKISLNIPRPNEDTLSRHSILGPNGLHGPWQPTRANEGVEHPSIVDLTPVQNPKKRLPYIVMAPRDSSSASNPHDPPPDGGPIYKACTVVYMNPNLKFDDLNCAINLANAIVHTGSI
uniref:Uncharacterized protein n=1 Tax=Populus trichocarpa TaxID=3694 RepID=B9I2K8_POPTR